MNIEINNGRVILTIDEEIHLSTTHIHPGSVLQFNNLQKEITITDNRETYYKLLSAIPNTEIAAYMMKLNIQ